MAMIQGRFFTDYSMLSALATGSMINRRCIRQSHLRCISSLIMFSLRVRCHVDSDVSTGIIILLLSDYSI